MNFETALENEMLANHNEAFTENGACGYATTGKALLDMNFKTSSYRHKSDEEIISDFIEAYAENPLFAIKWLFFARDVRGGMGERRLFRVCMKWLAENKAMTFIMALVPLIAEYGRYDDVVELLDSRLKREIANYIKWQLGQDIVNTNDNKPVSLLAKWLPSENASSEKTRKNARKLAKLMNMSNSEYRKILSKLRAHIKIVESQMSANNWSEINYEQVPSKANLNYANAFMRHDKERRTNYLDTLTKGKTKINAGTLYPCDIVSRYVIPGKHWRNISNVDTTLEELWKALPAYELSNTIVVADCSGSMMGTPWNVAHSLAIYCAQHNEGEFKNKYITFSEHPQLVNVTGETLRENLEIALNHNECANTNIERVFDLILDTAVKNNMSQNEIPANILIISDVEFDEAQGWRQADRLNETLFETISNKYTNAGYKLPRLVFWNVASRTNVVPVLTNELGVALVSGYSPAIMSMVTSGELDPYKCLLKTLNSDRYQAVEDALLSL